MILDTSFLIDVLRGEQTVEETVQIVDERTTARVSSISVMELWEGIQLANSSERERTAVKNLLTDVREVPFDCDCAMAAGTINANLNRNGVPIEDADVMIAATARVHGLPVLTKNVDHFERVAELEILTY